MPRATIARQIIKLVVEEGAVEDAGADGADQIDDEVKVVNGGKAQRQRLPGGEQVAQVAARVVLAGVAGAVVLDRGVVAGIARTLDVQPPVPGVEGAVAGDAGRRNAVEEVDAALDRLEEIFR